MGGAGPLSDHLDFNFRDKGHLVAHHTRVPVFGGLLVVEVGPQDGSRAIEHLTGATTFYGELRKMGEWSWLPSRQMLAAFSGIGVKPKQRIAKMSAAARLFAGTPAYIFRNVMAK